MTIHHNAASTATYTAAGTSIILWGMHLSDIAVIVSAAAAVIGVIVQIYVSYAQLRELRRERKKD